jgi:8-oxo-dGTP pyrophosphatase MutT (NUDIX family)
MIQPWPREGSRPLGDYRIFNIRSDAKKSPRTGKVHDFFVIDTADWVNVVALTSRDELVMIEQYRHGTNTVELEIPGGMIDPRDASPLAAGLRELVEETGYVGGPAEILGTIYPNPAIMTNTCHTVLVRNCQLKHEVNWDQGEDILTCLVSAAEIPALVAHGKIRHSLVVVALYFFDLWRRGEMIREGGGQPDP